jgi:hypothetical protein
MRQITARFAVLFALGSAAMLAHAAGSVPVPPIKMGLWEVKSSVLDASGKPQAPPEQTAMANLPPEIRERMAEMMKSRGVSMPDQSGATRTCQTKDSLDSGKWQALASSAGCTSEYSVQSGGNWKFHSSCPKLKSESDGEVVFTNAENYTSKVTTSSKLMGKDSTQTRVMVAHWLGANCGDVKPLTAEGIKAP